MASSSGSLRFADKFSLEEFPEGHENENTRTTTEHNIALLKKFLMPKDELRVFTRNCHTSANERTTNSDYTPSSVYSVTV